ncbi:hypothetical protein FOL46_003798 [Perkinsus olseni]|uniref:Uncharacterized protein n=1 Tax=Perkinsus olseni TaxID=32597 RepID=A0A7J6M0Y2_PEROL|nr:hypothetical protein FOL46_003798 [Perkinsus olseni]
MSDPQSASETSHRESGQWPVMKEWFALETPADRQCSVGASVGELSVACDAVETPQQQNGGVVTEESVKRRKVGPSPPSGDSSQDRTREEPYPEPAADSSPHVCQSPREDGIPLVVLPRLMPSMEPNRQVPEIPCELSGESVLLETPNSRLDLSSVATVILSTSSSNVESLESRPISQTSSSYPLRIARPRDIAADISLPVLDTGVIMSPGSVPVDPSSDSSELSWPEVRVAVRLTLVATNDDVACSAVVSHVFSLVFLYGVMVTAHFVGETLTWCLVRLQNPLSMAGRERLSAGVAADLAAAREQGFSDGLPRPVRPKLQGSSATNPAAPKQGAVDSKVREPTVSPKRRRVNSPNRRPLVRAHTGPVFQEKQAGPPLTRVATVAGGRVLVTRPSLRHGIKDVSIKNAAKPFPKAQEQENIPHKGNRLSLGSLNSVCLSDEQEVNLGDRSVEVEEEGETQWQRDDEQVYEQVQESPSPILQQQLSPEIETYRPQRGGNHPQQAAAYPDRASSARSMAPTVDLPDGGSEPPAWEYSFAAYGGQNAASDDYVDRTGVARDDELSQTQRQASQAGLFNTQVPPTVQQHASPEFGYRPYGQRQTAPAQTYYPSAQGVSPRGHRALRDKRPEVLGQSRGKLDPEVLTRKVSYPSFSGRTPAPPEARGVANAGVPELEGYRSDTSLRAQQNTFTPTQVEMSTDTPTSEASCSTYYGNLLNLGRAETSQPGNVTAGESAPPVWRAPQAAGQGLETSQSFIDRPPGRGRLSDIPLSKDIVGTVEIAEKLGKIIGKHLPGDAYDHHVYTEAFCKVIEKVRKECVDGASRANLSASHQALLAFADNMMGAWKENSIDDIFAKCKLLRVQARMELNLRGLIRPSQETVTNVNKRVEALNAVVESKRALLEKLRREKKAHPDRRRTSEDIIEEEIGAWKAASGVEETPPEPSYDLLFELGNRWVRMEFMTEEERIRGEWEDPGDDFESYNVPTAETSDLSQARSENEEATPSRPRRVRQSVGSAASMMAMDCGLEEFTS